MDPGHCSEKLQFCTLTRTADMVQGPSLFIPNAATQPETQLVEKKQQIQISCDIS